MTDEDVEFVGRKSQSWCSSGLLICFPPARSNLVLCTDCWRLVRGLAIRDGGKLQRPTAAEVSERALVPIAGRCKEQNRSVAALL